MTDTGYFTDLEKKEHKCLKKVYSFYSAFCTQPAFYSQSAVCILHSVCSLPLVRSLQSAVHSLPFTLTGKIGLFSLILNWHGARGS